MEVVPHPDEPCFDSFQEAVRVVQSGARAKQADSDTAQIKGRVVEGGAVEDQSLSLWLSGDLVLKITVSTAGVTWRLAFGGARLGTVPNRLLLKFPGDAPPFVWDRATLLLEMIGKEVVRLSATVAWVFLDLRTCQTLMFSRIWSADMKKDLLFFGPE